MAQADRWKPVMRARQNYCGMNREVRPGDYVMDDRGERHGIGDPGAGLLDKVI